MLVRYSTSKNGKVRKKAYVYTANEHGIKKADIDPDAVRVTERLRQAGHAAFIVGGAVRDLMLGKQPKDFDVVTDAVPRTIKKLFRNSRIIGKRFRLVHVFFGQKIIEVATFRSLDPENNTYGTLEEDVLRRDFRINALYFSPHDETIIDYVGGMKDVRSRKIHALIPLKKIFTEDPVRMIRAVKYSATTGFRIPLLVQWQIRRNSAGLAAVSSSRITEELFKILGSGVSSEIFQLSRRFNLLKNILPELDAFMNASSGGDFEKRFYDRMKLLDERMKLYGDIRKGRMLSFLLQEYIADKGIIEALNAASNGKIHELTERTFKETKQFLKPLVPPNIEVEAAVRFLLQSDRKRPVHRKPRTRHGPKKPAQGAAADTPPHERTHAQVRENRPGNTDSVQGEMQD